MIWSSPADAAADALCRVAARMLQAWCAHRTTGSSSHAPAQSHQPICSMTLPCKLRLRNIGIVLLQVPSHKAPHFQLLATALKEVYSSSGQELDVVPSLLSGGTDSKFYAHLSEHGVLRHIPITANRTAGDIQRIHGTDERVAVEDVRRAFCVYQRVVAGAGMLGDDGATV